MGITGVEWGKPHVLFVDRQGNQHYDRSWKQQVAAAALEPGASLSRVALDHGINTNLVRKWVRKHKEAQMEAVAPPLTSAFIPVQIEAAATDTMSGHNDKDRRQRTDVVGLKARTSGEMRHVPVKTAPFSCAARLNVTLPNGVKLSLECDDLRAVTAIIGAVSNV